LSTTLTIGADSGGIPTSSRRTLIDLPVREFGSRALMPTPPRVIHRAQAYSPVSFHRLPDFTGLGNPGDRLCPTQSPFRNTFRRKDIAPPASEKYFTFPTPTSMHGTNSFHSSDRRSPNRLLLMERKTASIGCLWLWVTKTWPTSKQRKAR